MRMIKVGDCREYNDERERELPQLLQVSPLFNILQGLFNGVYCDAASVKG